MVVAFVDSLRILSILLSELSLVREISVRQCSLISISKGGSLIAVASGSSIIIINFFTGEIVSNLRGHVSKIRSIQWLCFDSRLCSIGSDGLSSSSLALSLIALSISFLLNYTSI